EDKQLVAARRGVCVVCFHFVFRPSRVRRLLPPPAAGRAWERRPWRGSAERGGRNGRPPGRSERGYISLIPAGGGNRDLAYPDDGRRSPGQPPVVSVTYLQRSSPGGKSAPPALRSRQNGATGEIPPGAG